MNPSDDAPLVFRDAKQEATQSTEPPWKILIIDDEENVHTSTTFALNNCTILGRPLKFLHAYSAAEAKEVLRNEADIAVIFLDVVMETANAGLDLIKDIRETLQYTDTRIILRTGQPNQAPMLEVINSYDINDYKLKSELTQSSLFAALTTAIRAFRQISREITNRQGLNALFNLMAAQLSNKNYHNFANLFILHLSNLYHDVQNGLVCANLTTQFEYDQQLKVIAATGNYVTYLGEAIDTIKDDIFHQLVSSCLQQKANIYNENGMALYLGSHSRGNMVACIIGATELDSADQIILDLFSTNISICSDNLALMKDLRGYAYQDQKLNIPNRNALLKRLNKLYSEDQLDNFSLIEFGIDHFSDINAALGEEYGDSLLVAITDRVKKSLPAECILARAAGDTFIILSPTDAITAKDILKLFRFPFFVNDDGQTVSCTLGVLNLKDIKGDANEALKAVNIVSVKAKKNHRGNFLNFEPYMLTQAKDRLTTLDNLRHDFVRQNLFLAYQPTFKFKSGKISGCEALLRWQQPDGSFISPALFIPLAEQSGFINRLGRWVFQQAMEELRWLHENGWPELKMAVNLSVLQLKQHDILIELESIAHQFNIDPKYVELEITESVAMGDVEKNILVLKQIKALGFKIALDDFGTGYSSLNLLRRLPIDRVKIDKYFVDSIDSVGGQDFLKLIIQLAHSLKIQVTAEGIEKLSQLNLLKALGCDSIQGFHYALPMANRELHQWLSKVKNP